MEILSARVSFVALLMLVACVLLVQARPQAPEQPEPVNSKTPSIFLFLVLKSSSPACE